MSGAAPTRTLLPLADAYGRVATDLRVSLTDRCNLRCSYCMPPEGLAWTPDEQLLTNDELVRLVRIGVERLGIRSVRLTGGEPLLRPDLPAVIEAIAALTPRPTIAMTTNGIGLASRAAQLRSAGLDRVNVSLDTLDPERFRRMTRRKRHADVLAGIRAAREAGLAPVKVNSVLLRGVNDDEAPALVQWAGREGVQLRFIEQMPLDAQHGWRRDTMVTAEEVLAALAGLDLRPVAQGPSRGSAPAETYRVGETDQVVGVIASVSRPFCGACDRVRLTADGQVRNCLFSRSEDDLRHALRTGAGDAAIAELWIRAVAGKRAGHGIDDPSFLQPDRPMSAIGG